MIDSQQAYLQKKQQLLEEFALMLKSKKKHNFTVGLGKKTSNLFRDRSNHQKKIDVRSFNRVISIDADHQTAEVEGMTTYEDFVQATLPYGLLPAVVPELKLITIGGATTGIGIESSSFRYGFVHETVLEMEILTGDGRIVHCTKNNEHKELFFGFPNSYGSLGYALKLKIQLVPAKKYVFLHHIRFDNASSFFQELAKLCQNSRNSAPATPGLQADGPHFIDGTVFSPTKLYITQGTFADQLPTTQKIKVSNYKYMNKYFESIRHKKTDALTVTDYIWRWDTDWFWCSKHFMMQNPLLRLLFGKFTLNSAFYWKARRWFEKTGLGKKLQKWSGKKLEWIIQDVEIPLENCEAFLDFFQKEIGITPVWICPVAAYNPHDHYDLYGIEADKLYVNFGFWDCVATTQEDGYYNRLIEAKVQKLKGKKSLYSTSYYSRGQFWKLYNKKAYDRLKKNYDPDGTFKDLYEKCVRKG